MSECLFWSAMASEVHADLEGGLDMDLVSQRLLPTLVQVLLIRYMSFCTQEASHCLVMLLHAA